MADVTLAGDGTTVNVVTDVVNKEIVMSGIGGDLNQAGVVQLATRAEITQGTNTTKAITARDVKTLIDALLS